MLADRCGAAAFRDEKGMRSSFRESLKEPIEEFASSVVESSSTEICN
jgi:hypothetical protein